MRGNIASVMLGLLVLLPGMVVSGFMPELDVLPFWGWCLVTAFGGLLAGAIGIEQRPLLGAVSGFVGCLGTVPAILFYVDWRSSLSDTFMTIEFVVPMLVAMVPGFVVFAIGKRMLPGADEAAA